MRTKKDGEFRSSVYTQRPPYADFDAPRKFQAIQSIIAKRLREEMQYRRALRLIVKTCCIWLGGAAYVLAVIAGYGHMMDVAAVTGAIAIGLSVYGAM
nr:MAG TPA: hypothetical protein [Caudoviricetes sp.]